MRNCIRETSFGIALLFLAACGCPGVASDPGDLYGKCPQDGGSCDRAVADGCLHGEGDQSQCVSLCQTDNDCEIPGSCVLADPSGPPLCVIPCAAAGCPEGYECSENICWPV